MVGIALLSGSLAIVPKAEASGMSIKEFIRLLIIIDVISQDKVPAVNAYLATLSDDDSSLESEDEDGEFEDNDSRHDSEDDLNDSDEDEDEDSDSDDDSDDDSSDDDNSSEDDD